MGDDSEVRVNVPAIVHSKWDEMIVEYNSVMTKINQITRQGSATFHRRSGRTVDLNELASRMGSIPYKLYWACKSLEYLTEFYAEHTKSFEEAEHSLTEEASDLFIFKADVFFSFAYSALDIVAEVMYMLVETDLNRKQVSFVNVLNSLTNSKNVEQVDDMFTALRKESDTGWIYEFRLYRVFVTHHGTIQLRGQFTYTAGDHTVEISLHMLPDNPRKRPLTFEKKRELAPYCLEVIVKELSVMKALFEFVGKLI